MNWKILLTGAAAGAAAAARIDLEAFKDWKSWDFSTEFDWKRASFRWFRGAVLGAAAAGGIQLF